ncbi:MAG: phage tail protein [Chlorobiaceae bacterium]|nr:phage tail protein [Chlorobiaceae bacterium]
MDDGYLTQIMLFAGNFAPRNWAFCAGQILPINQNTALFSLVGTMYGGDGRSTFALPDLREKDEQGNPHIGYELGKPSWIICTQGMYPTRE